MIIKLYLDLFTKNNNLIINKLYEQDLMKIGIIRKFVKYRNLIIVCSEFLKYYQHGNKVEKNIQNKK